MKILITGITGTLGQEVLKQLLNNPSIDKIIGYSRDEMKQRSMPKSDKLVMVLGDIRDRNRLIEASRGVDIIFHFAALKCVDTLEDNPEESIATNVLGTENVLHAQRMNGIKRVVLSSTDKAVYPINVYGNCKALAERLVMRNKNNVVVRYGNVMASRGSAIPMFIKSLKEKKTVYVTSRDMTRFFIKIEDAAEFVIFSAFRSEGGLRIYEKMKSTNMLQVVRALSELLKIKNYSVNLIGLRPGEKLNEDLVAAHEGKYLNSYNSKKYTLNELKEMLSSIVSEYE